MQEPTTSTEEETSISARDPDHLDQTQHEILTNDAQFQQNIRDLSLAITSEDACKVDESRESTPVPEEDTRLLMHLNQSATIKDLASLVASSYAARDVYELHKPALIWNNLLKGLGPDGVSDLLLCAYLDGDCLSFSVNVDCAIHAWAGRLLYPSRDLLPGPDVVENMLCLYLGMTSVINRLLAQRHCVIPTWAQGYKGPLFDMPHMTVFQPVWEQYKAIDIEGRRRIYHVFFLAYIVCQAWDRRDPIRSHQSATLFSAISDNEAIEACRLLYRLGNCQSAANDDGPVGEMVKIFRLVRGTSPMFPNEAKPQVVILEWIKPHLPTKDIFEPIER